MISLKPDAHTYQEQLQEKATALENILAAFSPPKLQIFDSPPSHYRLRAEFRLWHENQKLHYAMFKPGSNNQPIFIENFPIASPRINELMPQLKAAWQSSDTLRRKLFQIEFLTTLAGDALVTLCYHRPLDETWLAEAKQLSKALNINIVGRSKGKKWIIGRDYVNETICIAGRTFTYQQPEGSFSQPNGEVNIKMLSWAHSVLNTKHQDLLELYCGNGNFTLPLSTKVRKVLATEISKPSVRAATENIKNNQIQNVTLARLSAEELTEALNGVRPFRRLAHIDLLSYNFSTIFVDPPRAGMDFDTCELARQFDYILYISCNPKTLIANIEQLHNTHKITACALFDQFPYTSHVESGVLLKRR
ncbi:UNVERIFIED_CONTAM: hypothetical protein GTU68_052108 [Idotea baltica]|nr:hypothetical protein [Idotea baltica]